MKFVKINDLGAVITICRVNYPDTIPAPEYVTHSHVFVDGEWTIDPNYTAPEMFRPLTQEQWAYLIDPDVTDFGAVIDAAVATFPAGKSRARLRSKLQSARVYTLETVLGFTQTMRALNVPNVPTDAEIKSAWLEAANG